jgi:hypothetical protein
VEWYVSVPCKFNVASVPNTMVCRAPRPVVDPEEHIIAMLGWQLRGPEWDNVASNTTKAMEKARQQREWLKGAPWPSSR